MDNNTTRTQQQRCTRQARWQAEYLDGLCAQIELEDAPASDVRGLRRRVHRGSKALDSLMADLDALICHVLHREFGWNTDFEDLVQDARLHALEMIRIWKPGHGASISSWAVMYLPQTLRRMRRKETDLKARGLVSIESEPGLVKHLTDVAPSPDEVVTGARIWLDLELGALLSELCSSDRHLVETLLVGRSSELGRSERGRARAILGHPSLQLTGIVGATGVLAVDGSASWLKEAACAGMHVSGFFPGRGETVSIAALRTCANCPVREECLAAVLSRTMWPGMWGGTSAKQRRALRAGASGARPSEFEEAA